MEFYRHWQIEFDQNFHVEWQFVYSSKGVLPWVSKVIRICFGFAIKQAIGLKISRANLSSNQNWSKTKTNHDSLAPVFVFALSFRSSSLNFDWFTGLSVWFVIRQSDWVLSIMPKIPEISVEIQTERSVSVSSDRNIRDHLWRWSTYFGRNIPTEICHSEVDKPILCPN